MITIEHLIHASQLGLEVRVPGAASQTWIRGVHIVQTIDEISRLRGDELVLTDSSARHDFPADERVVDTLAHHGAAVLGYAPSTPHGTPAGLVKACRRRRLPLIEIPPSVTCGQVAQATMGLLHGRRSSDVSGVMRREHTLAKLLANRSGIRAMLMLLCKEYGVRLWLVTGGVAVAPDAHGPPREDVQAVLMAAGRQRGAFEIDLSGNTSAFVYPLNIADHRCRRTAYCVCELPADGLSPELRIGLDQGVSFVEAAIAMRDALREARRPSEEEFMRRIEAGQAAPEEIDAWGRALGFQSRGHLTCVLVRGAQIRERAAEEVAHALRDLADSLGMSHIVATTIGEVRALLVTEGAGDLDIDAELIGTRAMLDKRLGQLDVAWGASSVLADSVSDFSRVLLDARQVCILNSLRQDDSTREKQSDQSLCALLLTRDDEALAALHEAILTPLLDYDNAHGSDLVHTLDVFLSACGQWNTSASQLKIHVNTLRYRLGRVEQVTGRTLRSMSDRVDLYLAIRTRAYRESDSVTR